MREINAVRIQVSMRSITRIFLFHLPAYRCLRIYQPILQIRATPMSDFTDSSFFYDLLRQRNGRAAPIVVVNIMENIRFSASRIMSSASCAFRAIGFSHFAAVMATSGCRYCGNDKSTTSTSSLSITVRQSVENSSNPPPSREGFGLPLVASAHHFKDWFEVRLKKGYHLPPGI